MESVIVYNLEDPPLVLEGLPIVLVLVVEHLKCHLGGDMDTRGAAAFKTQEVDCVRALHKMFELCPNV